MPAELVIPNTYNDGEHGEANIVDIEDVLEGANRLAGGFYNNDDIVSVVLPSTITSLKFQAFGDCDNLKHIRFAPNAQITSIDSTTFGVTNLKSIVIPASLTDMSLISLAELESIVVEEGNTKYTSRDANGNECNALIEIATNTLVMGCKNTVIPNTVEVIGDAAFAGCEGLESITIPNSVTTISWSAFSNCTSLTEVVIPASVTTIGTYVFGGCTNLTEVTFEDCDAWTCTNDEGSTILDAVELSDKAIAATYLTETYLPYSWTLSNEE